MASQSTPAPTSPFVDQIKKLESKLRQAQTLQASGGSAAGVDNSGAPEDPAFVEGAGEAEEEMWTRALAALDEDEVWSWKELS